MDEEKLKIAAKLPNHIYDYLPFALPYQTVYQSEGLSKHIEKRHLHCLPYMERIPEIITHPDYIGINPNETVISFELVKTFDDNVQIGIKLDSKNDYLYVATLHDITQSKLQKRITNGRLKNIDKPE